MKLACIYAIILGTFGIINYDKAPDANIRLFIIIENVFFAIPCTLYLIGEIVNYINRKLFW